MNQVIESPNAEDIADVDAMRKWVREHYEPEAEHNYDTVEGKLVLINGILQNGWGYID